MKMIIGRKRPVSRRKPEGHSIIVLATKYLDGEDVNWECFSPEHQQWAIKMVREYRSRWHNAKPEEKE